MRRWWGRPRDRRPGEGRWIVVDTETSGLDPHRDRLLAVGGVAVDPDGIVPADSFEVVLHNTPAPDARDALIHGIGHAAQRAGVPSRDALTAFLQWAGDAPAVGFHAVFDRVVIGRALGEAGLTEDARPWLDLAPLARALAPDAAKRGAESLDDWLVRFGIECTARHNAAADACATAELLLCLRDRAACQGARGWDALTRISRDRRWL